MVERVAVSPDLSAVALAKGEALREVWDPNPLLLNNPSANRLQGKPRHLDRNLTATTFPRRCDSRGCAGFGRQRLQPFPGDSMPWRDKLARFHLAMIRAHASPLPSIVSSIMKNRGLCFLRLNRIPFALVAVFFLLVGAVTMGRAANVYLGNGIKIGEVTADSVIVWTRLTVAPEANWKGASF